MSLQQHSLQTTPCLVVCHCHLPDSPFWAFWGLGDAHSTCLLAVWFDSICSCRRLLHPALGLAWTIRVAAAHQSLGRTGLSTASLLQAAMVMTTTGPAAATITVSSTQSLVAPRGKLPQAQLSTLGAAQLSKVQVRTAASAGSSHTPLTVFLGQPAGRQNCL